MRQKKLKEIQTTQSFSPILGIRDGIIMTKDFGMTKAAAAGVLANIQSESNFNPQAIGDYGQSLGLCQWFAERCRRLQEYCQQQGIPCDTIPSQMDYLRYELTTFYPYILDEINACENTPNGAYEAADIFCQKFERPQSMVAAGKVRGQQATEEIWPNMANCG